MLRAKCSRHWGSLLAQCAYGAYYAPCAGLKQSELHLLLAWKEEAFEVALETLA